MKESPLQKLQRLAREKKAAEASAAASAPAVPEEKQDGLVNDSVNSTTVIDVRNEQDAQLGSTESGLRSIVSNGIQDIPVVSDSGGSSSTNFPAAPSARSASNHPLAMQFAELEQGILARDPQFKTILRDIHRQLGTEPELVTQMTEAEIALVVQGLVQRAQEEIVTPAATKAAKKKVITVDDL